MYIDIGNVKKKNRCAAGACAAVASLFNRSALHFNCTFCFIMRVAPLCQCANGGLRSHAVLFVFLATCITGCRFGGALVPSTFNFLTFPPQSHAFFSGRVRAVVSPVRWHRAPHHSFSFAATCTGSCPLIFRRQATSRSSER